jgi:hypothetical protein
MSAEDPLRVQGDLASEFTSSTTSTFADDLPVFGDHVTAVDQITSSSSFSHPLGRRRRPVFRGYLVPNGCNQPSPDIGGKRLNCCQNFINGCHAKSLQNTGAFSTAILEQHDETMRRPDNSSALRFRPLEFAGVLFSGCNLQGFVCDKL